MSTFAILLLCIQACLIHSTFGQLCGCGVPAPVAAPAVAPCGLGPSAYSGAGVGNVAVAGGLGVSGITAVAGAVPVQGQVTFGGTAYARGSGVITGSCTGCGCGCSL